MCEWQVKLCDPVSTRATTEHLRDKQLIIKRHTNEAYFTLLANAMFWVQLYNLWDEMTTQITYSTTVTLQWQLKQHCRWWKLSKC